MQPSPLRGPRRGLRGLTACHGPGPRWIDDGGHRRRLHRYAARSAPRGPDDGIVAPRASTASLPFVPDVVLPTLRRLAEPGGVRADCGLRRSFNPTWPRVRSRVSLWHYGFVDGPLVLRVENHRSGPPWSLTRRCARRTSAAPGSTPRRRRS